MRVIFQGFWRRDLPVLRTITQKTVSAIKARFQKTTSQNIFQKNRYFFDGRKYPSRDHDSPQIHPVVAIRRRSQIANPAGTHLRQGENILPNPIKKSSIRLEPSGPFFPSYCSRLSPRWPRKNLPPTTRATRSKLNPTSFSSPPRSRASMARSSTA